MNEFIEKLIGRLEEKAHQTWLVLAERNGYERAIEIVKHEAEQYNNGWVPCSEKLPDDFMSFEYLTIRKGHTLATITYYCVANHKWYLSRNSSKEIDVIAWQPLPEPYQPKGE